MEDVTGELCHGPRKERVRKLFGKCGIGGFFCWLVMKLVTNRNHHFLSLVFDDGFEEIHGFSAEGNHDGPKIGPGKICLTDCFPASLPIVSRS